MENQQQKNNQVKDINEKYLGDFTKNELTTLRNTIARGTNDQEFMLFVQTCVNTGLNPFLNHIHCMVYEGKNGRQLSIQISSEGVLYLARKAKGFKGIDAQLVHENDEFVIDLATKKIVKHEIGFPRGKVIGGYTIARHEDFEDKILLMDVQEVEHMKRGKNGHMWNTWFNDMFKKHMLKRVAKEQYGIDLTEDEASVQPSFQQPQEQSAGRIEIGESEVIDETDKKKEMWQSIEENVEGSVIEAVLQKYFKGKSEKDLTLQEMAGFKKFCEMEMNRKNEVVEEEQPMQNEVNEIDEMESYFE